MFSALQRVTPSHTLHYPATTRRIKASSASYQSALFSGTLAQDTFVRSAQLAHLPAFGLNKVTGVNRPNPIVPVVQDDSDKIFDRIIEIWKKGEIAQFILDYDGTLVAKRTGLDKHGNPAMTGNVVDIDTADPPAPKHVQEVIRLLALNHKDLLRLNILTARDFKILLPHREHPFSVLGKTIIKSYRDLLGISDFERLDGDHKAIYQIYKLMPVLAELERKRAKVQLVGLMGGWHFNFDNKYGIPRQSPSYSEFYAAELALEYLQGKPIPIPKEGIELQQPLDQMTEDAKRATCTYVQLNQPVLHLTPVKNNPLFFRAVDGTNTYVEMKSAGLVLHHSFVNDDHPLVKAFLDVGAKIKVLFPGLTYNVHQSGGGKVKESEIIPAQYAKENAIRKMFILGQVPAYCGDSSSDVGAINEAIQQGGIGILVNQPKPGESVDEMKKRLGLNPKAYVVPDHEALVHLLYRIDAEAGKFTNEKNKREMQKQPRKSFFIPAPFQFEWWFNRKK